MREHRRALLGGSLLLAIAIAPIFFSPEFREYYQHFFLLQEKNSLFYLTFFGLLTLACLTSIFPASIIAAFAGAVFGILEGFALSASAMLIAAFIAFTFSRYFFHIASRRLVAKVIDLDKFDTRLARHGWRYALLIRLTPLAPFSITSFGLGLTPITLSQYMLTTLAALPFLVVCVYLGSMGGVLISAGGVDSGLLWRVALLFSAGASVLAFIMHWLPRLARRLLTPGEE